MRRRGKRVEQRLFVDHRSPADVDDDRVGSHRGKGLGSEQTTRIVLQRQRGDDDIDARAEGIELAERVGPVDEFGVRDRAAIGRVDTHVEGFCALCDGLADMAEAQQSDRLSGDFAMHAVARAGPPAPVVTAKATIGIDDRHLAHEQGTHHIFCDGLFVPEAVAYGSARRQARDVDGVVARTGDMKQGQFGRNRKACIEGCSNHHIGRCVARALLVRLKSIRQGDNVGGATHQWSKALQKCIRVLAMEDDLQRPGGSVVGHLDMLPVLAFIPSLER